ncbi:MAG: alpha-L-arabinofuranosidase C-terminal domain-containing protein [Tepidisphaeraceae bacterium]
MYQYWKYRSTDGFGYHEYLTLCEELKAEPVYAVFGGMTVHPDDNVPLDQLQPYIDNALNAIEYARGPVTSKWGAERVKMGHPEPFKLNYIEIGNEHATPLYGEYYKRFREQIKARYPDMTVVMSMFWSGLNPPAIERAGDANIDMVDEHCYRDVNWARANFHYFDRYARGKWPVFVGEYASQRANGDWAGGMGDSVFLMMCERNGDLVKMACYAPLFRNVNDTSWPVNLIDFDSSRSYAHGSYYVQKTFVENRPDVNLPLTSEVLPKVDDTKPLLAGKIGLGAWDSQVEYKELRVYDEKDQLVYSDDFTDLAGWDRPVNGRWSAEGGTLKQTAGGETPAMILLNKIPELKTGRITVKARKTGGREGFNIFFNASGIDRFLFCNYGADGNKFSAIHDRGAPEDTVFRGGRSTPGPIENDRWYDLAVTIKNNSAEMFLDGKRVSSAHVDSLPKFFSAAGFEQKTNTVIVKATNYFATPTQAKISLDNVAGIAAGAKMISIKNDNLTGDNNFESPTRIKPVETSLPVNSKEFTVELPPYSVNVLRIPIQP